MTMKTSFAPNLLLLLVTCVLVFGLLEIGVRLLVDMREQAPVAIHGVDPDKPIRFQPGFETRYSSSEFDYSVRFNRFGRRDVEWSDAEVADPDSVIMIGDSFVLGNSVEYEDTLATLAEGHLAAAGRPREVMNFGMPAGAPPTYRLLLEDALASGFAAETILVGIFVGNDFYPSVLRAGPLDLREKKAPPHARAPRSELLRFLRLRVSQSPRLVGWALAASGALGITLYDTAGSYVFLRHQTPEQEALFAEILGHVGRMQELCEAHGRRLLVVIFPNKIQVENAEDLTSSVFDADLPQERVLAYCRKRGIPCLDLLPIVRAAEEASAEPLYFPIDRHLNEAGSAVAARAIADFLLEAEAGEAGR